MKPVNLDVLIQTEQYDRQFKCINCGYYWDDHRIVIEQFFTARSACPVYNPNSGLLYAPSISNFKSANDEDS